jgi:hypothetical protein
MTVGGHAEIAGEARNEGKRLFVALVIEGIPSVVREEQPEIWIRKMGVEAQRIVDDVLGGDGGAIQFHEKASD